MLHVSKFQAIQVSSKTWRLVFYFFFPSQFFIICVISSVFFALVTIILTVEFCCGFLRRSHCEAGHVVPCVCRRSQGVHSPHWPEPDQPVVPWTYTVGETHSDFWKLTYCTCEIMHKCMANGYSYIGGSYSSCSVQIRFVKLSDAGQYHFRFETDQPLGRWTSPNTITLDVTGRLIQTKTAVTSVLWH